jgi:FHA domain
MPADSRRAPIRLRHRRRWIIAAVVAGAWLVLMVATGSLPASVILLFLLAALAACAVVGARLLGIDSSHPVLRRLASRPWRNGQDVWQVALKHLPETFLVAPDRSLLASDVVELRMNPGDLDALAESIDLDLVGDSSSEAYQARITERGARLAGTGEPRVILVSDPDLAPGRYRLRARSTDPREAFATDGAPVAAPHPEAPPAGAAAADAPPAGVGHPARTVADRWTANTVAEEQLTSPEAQPLPLLRLVTGGTLAQTRKSGARVGRGSDVELRLPNVPTVSRVHAEFTFTDGRWWISNRGRNGLTLNGALLVGKRPVSDGDVIGWGSRPDALTSRIEIGRPVERAAATLP